MQKGLPLTILLLVFSVLPAYAELTPYDFGLDARFDPDFRFQSSTSTAQVSGDIDLLWEADSYVPPFFRGRALPSAGTNLRLQAIAHFRDASGAPIPSQNLQYTWRRNGYVIAGVSGEGKSKVIIPAPPLFGSDTISVETKKDGITLGSASERISSIEPSLDLYENHPLFGILYHQAFPAQNFIPEEEASFIVIPYFAQARNENDPNLIYEWKVNGHAVQNGSRPSEITINASNSSGTAFIELALSHLTNIYLNVAHSWAVIFEGSGSSGLFEKRSP